MSDTSYEAIAPLVASAQQAGRSMRFVFKCPATGQQVQASYSFQHDPGAQSRVVAAAKRSIWYEVRRQIGYFIRAAFGHNVIGRMAADMANAAVTASQTGQSTAPKYSDEDRKVATVEAFKSVVGKFAWDTRTNRWISRQASQAQLSPFERQIAEHPVEHPYDRDILSRMLVEVGCSDGRLGEEEEAFLLEFMEGGADVEQLAQRPELSEEELGETSTGAVRETLLLLATSLALTDERYDPAEQKKLDLFARGLGLAGPKRAEVLKKAQSFVLDEAMEKMVSWGGHDQAARDELLALADRIGMDRRAAAVAEAQFQKRRQGR